MPILPIKLYEYKQQCMQKLDTEVKNALEAVKVEFSLNPVWDRYLERCQELIDFDNLLKIDCSRTDMHMQINVKDCKMLRLIKEILLGYGININNVEIVLANSKTTSSAGSVNQRVSNDKIYHSMTFKNKLLKKRCSTLERKAIIHHEVNHLLNYDAMRENQLLCFLRDLGFDKDKIENAKSIINFRHAKEFRADLSFAVNHPELIVGLQEFLNRLMKKQDQCNQELWKTHPPTIQRIEQLNLVKQFLAPHYSF